MAEAKNKRNIKWKVAQFLEIRWWQNYLGKKEVEAYLDNKRQYWQRVLAQIHLQVPISAKVLDAGCGPAGIFMALPQAEVQAIDPLLEAYAQKIRHFDAAAYPWVVFQPIMLESFAEKEQYDYVFCLNAINHVADINRGFAVLAKATKEKGVVVVSIDAHRFGFLKWIFRLIPGDLLHPHQYDLADYAAMCEREGIKLTQKVKLKPGIIFDYWILIGHKTGRGL